MRLISTLVACLITLLAGVASMVPRVASAGVPRSCIYPTYHPLECSRDTRQQYEKIIRPARLRVLRHQRHELRRVRFFGGEQEPRVDPGRR